MVCACIDIGTNTTRLLVAQPAPGGLRELLAQRVFTRVGGATGPDGTIAPAKLAEVVDVVICQAKAARDLGCGAVRAVATAAIRDAPNRAELVAAVRAATGVELEILSADDEARLAFQGATRTLPAPPTGTVGVVDLGGGSTEIAVGTMAGGVQWWTSVALGSGSLVDAHVRHDPPAAPEIAAMRHHAATAFAGVTPPPADLALGVGGSATSLRRLAGDRLDAAALGAALDELAATPAAEVAERHGLDAERVRLLPGALALLEQVTSALGTPLEVARGGLREGVILAGIDAASGNGRGA
jgi:exopolyphosphatase/guanosine-5'-triphosphate,3'-diphosphate pyrophosphatase